MTPFDIMSENPHDVQLIFDLAGEALAFALVNAAPETNLLRSDGIMQWQWNKPAELEAVLLAASAAPGVSTEREAVLRVMLASAQRRMMPRDYPGAETNLKLAEGLIPKVAEVNGAVWAERIRGAIRNERCQIMRPSGNYFGAAQNYYEMMIAAHAAGDRAEALQTEREWAKNLLDGLITEGSYSAELIELAFGILWSAVERSIAFFTDQRNLAQAICDRIRGEWLTNSQQDKSRFLAGLGKIIEEDESMRRGFGWSWSILYRANMLSPDRSPTTEELEEALRLARATANDETMGPEWRPEAMLVAAQLLIKLGRLKEAMFQLEKLEGLDYIGPAKTLGINLATELFENR